MRVKPVNGMVNIGQRWSTDERAAWPDGGDSRPPPWVPAHGSRADPYAPTPAGRTLGARRPPAGAERRGASPPRRRVILDVTMPPPDGFAVRRAPPTPPGAGLGAGLHARRPRPQDLRQPAAAGAGRRRRAPALHPDPVGHRLPLHPPPVASGGSPVAPSRLPASPLTSVDHCSLPFTPLMRPLTPPHTTRATAGTGAHAPEPRSRWGRRAAASAPISRTGSRPRWKREGGAALALHHQAGGAVGRAAAIADDRAP